MPAAKNAPTAAKLVPAAAEASTATRANRVRLSKVLAAKPGQKPVKVSAPAKQTKSNGGKPKKLKLVSNRYKIPDNEYAQLTAVKKRLLALGVSAKRSELLRAGLMLLVALEDVQLKKAVAQVELTRASQPATKAN
ncbi:MAG: hypothetical protein M0P95_15980 [Sulfuritalea sp.]|jgi:hypothetical protein|nr:hypothetical protein [Sulfuritalea sp.]